MRTSCQRRRSLALSRWSSSLWAPSWTFEGGGWLCGVVCVCVCVCVWWWWGGGICCCDRRSAGGRGQRAVQCSSGVCARSPTNERGGRDSAWRGMVLLCVLCPPDTHSCTGVQTPGRQHNTHVCCVGGLEFVSPV
jgi:hypothetical protein